MSNKNCLVAYRTGSILKFIALVFILSIVASAAYNSAYFSALGIKILPLTFRDYFNSSIVFAPLLALLVANFCAKNNEECDFDLNKSERDSGIAKLLSISAVIISFVLYYLFYGKQIFSSITFYGIVLTALCYLFFLLLRHKGNKGNKFLQVTTLLLFPFFLFIFPYTLGVEIAHSILKRPQMNVGITLKDGAKLESVEVLRHLERWIIIKHGKNLQLINNAAVANFYTAQRT